MFILTTALFCTGGIALIYSEPIAPFVFSALISLTLGILFLFSTSRQKDIGVVNKREAYITVTFAWLFLGLIGCLPYLFSKSIPVFADALFESVSGFSTTGSSILSDIEALPKSILFWRSLTHWIGGIGIIVLVIIVMPTLRMGSYHLFSLESSLQERIQPKILAVGKRLLYIYVALTFLEVLLLLLFGMNWFESFCHAFGTVATGGFSPKNTSLIDYSPAIQYIVMIFMFLAGVNFTIHYFIIKGRFSKIKENEELKYYFGVTVLLGLILTASIYFEMGKPFEESFREAFFQIVSIITCTGFATADYLQWPSYAILILFFAMFLGGSTGSTAGGIKIARHIILFKSIRRIFRKALSSNAVIPIQLNKQLITDNSVNSILTFISVYFLTFLVLGSLIFSLGVNAQTSFSAVATCMAGIGPGLDLVGPVANFGNLPQAVKYILSFAMILGRLELYTILILFIPTFWRK